MRKKQYTLDNVLDTTRAGIRLIQQAEGFRAHWYKCPAGVWTIGYGATEGIVRGLTRRLVPGPISEQAATKMLLGMLATIYEPVVERNVRAPLTPGQFSALVSFSYNVGEANFRQSTLLRLLNEGRDYKAAYEFEKWVYAKGKKLPGLVKRREAEMDLFMECSQSYIWRAIANLEPMDRQPVAPIPTRMPVPVLRLFNQL